MPHMPGKRYVVASCHVERPLDDRCWAAFASLQERRPGGLAVAALMRPPDPDAGEDEARWLERAREAAGRGPLGHHTHFVGPGHARTEAFGPEHADRVRREAAWLREQSLEPRFFCGGGWYMDEQVAVAAAEAGYADCTATAFRPSYLPARAPHLTASAPAWLALPGGKRLLELPTTHSLGMAARASVGSRALPAYLHVYFHDTDLLSGSRWLALAGALSLLARRSTPADLDDLRREASATAPQTTFADAARQ
jgi:hypothetical protein